MQSIISYLNFENKWCHHHDKVYLLPTILKIITEPIPNLIDIVLYKYFTKFDSCSSKEKQYFGEELSFTVVKKGD